MVSRFVRKVRTASGAVAVQVVTRRGRQVEQVEHVGSAHTDAELTLLVSAARERLPPGQDVLDLGDLASVPVRMDDVADWTTTATLSRPQAAPAGGRRPVVAGGGRVVGTSAVLLWDVLTSAYTHLGFDVLADEGFRAMVLARIVEPTSKAEVVRVLGEIGAPGPSLRTLFRSLARAQTRDYRGRLAKACLAHSARTTGTGALVLYDVTTLHFEIDDEDDLRKVGMSKEHRVDPQVQVGLLVDPGGFPLEMHLFEGNKAETTTLVPVLEAFQARHGVTDMVVVADAGMLSAANLNVQEPGADASFLVTGQIDHRGHRPVPTAVRQVVHADRGASMTSKTVAALLSDLDVTRSHSRPRVSNDNPYSESWFGRLRDRLQPPPQRHRPAHPPPRFTTAWQPRRRPRAASSLAPPGPATPNASAPPRTPRSWRSQIPPGSTSRPTTPASS